MSRLGLGETRRDIPTVPTQPDKTQGTSMLAGLAPLGASTPLRSVAGCWGQGAPSQSSGDPGPDVSTTFFGCCPSDCTCPLHPV